MYTSQAVHAFIHWLFTLCDVWSDSGSTQLSGSGRVCLWIRESVSLAPGECVPNSPSDILLPQSSCM